MRTCIRQVRQCCLRPAHDPAVSGQAASIVHLHRHGCACGVQGCRNAWVRLEVTPCRRPCWRRSCHLLHRTQRRHPVNSPVHQHSISHAARTVLGTRAIKSTSCAVSQSAGRNANSTNIRVSAESSCMSLAHRADVHAVRRGIEAASSRSVWNLRPAGRSF